MITNPANTNTLKQLALIAQLRHRIIALGSDALLYDLYHDLQQLTATTNELQ